jgi:hypothetical protein
LGEIPRHERRIVPLLGQRTGATIIDECSACREVRRSLTNFVQAAMSQAPATR